MSENSTEQQQAQLKQVESFYNAVVDNLKNQIADMADQKAVQFVQSQQVIQSLSEKMKEMEQKLIDKKIE